MKKRLVWLGTILLLLLCITGCGKSAEKEKNENAGKYVYKVQQLDTGVKLEGGIQLMQGKENCFISHYNYNGAMGKAMLTLMKINEDYSVKQIASIPFEENESANLTCVSDQGNFGYIKSKYADGETVQTDEYSLVILDAQGKELSSTNINSIPEVAKKIDDYFYVDTILSQNSNFYVMAVGCILKFDEKGQYVSLISNDTTQNKLSGAQYVQKADGRVLAVVNGETNLSICEMDLNKGEIKNQTELSNASYRFSISPGFDYDVYLSDQYAMYGYNMGDKDKTELFNYMDSDMSFYSLTSIIPLSKTEFLAAYDNGEDGSSLVGKFTKVDPKDVKEKKVITLAFLYSNWTIKKQALEFNQTNEEYRIQILDYSNTYASDTDMDAPVKAMNTDIAAGKIPDILIVPQDLSVETYVSKGLFEDFTPYLDQDQEIDKADMMPNIVEAYTQNDKLYHIIPSFTIETLAAKTSLVGSEKGWSIRQVEEAMAKMPEGAQFMVNATRDDILKYCVEMAGSQFVDYKTGKCNFDSQEFKDLLAFVQKFPESIDENSYTDSFWNNYDTLWRKNQALCYYLYLDEYRSYQRVRYGTFGEEMTLIGFPSENQSGSIIAPQMDFAMSAKSKYKDGCWQFIRYFLTDEYQNGENIYGFPIMMKSLDKRKQAALEKPYYLNDDGSKEYYEDTFYLDNVEIEIPPMTAEEADWLTEQLKSFTTPSSTNTELMNIIREETAAYFSNQKSVDDVARIVQSRAQIYVNESR